MARTPAEKRDAMMPMSLESMISDYPCGLTICLGDAELTKIGLTGDCEFGDEVALDVIAKVMTVRKDETGCNITLQITQMGVEEEPENDVPAGPPASRAKRYATSAAEEAAEGE
jgi:hypothetical protein